MKLTLRLRQLEALTAARTRYEQGLRRMLIQLPTGVGKTPTFAALRDFFGFKKRVLILVHRDKLAKQAAKQLKKWNPDESVGVEMGAKYRSKPTDMFVVASVPTLSREDSPRLLQFNPDDFDAVICDEAHHSAAVSWRAVLSHFGFFDEVPSDRLLLGVTATPNRGDGLGLGAIFDEMVYQYSMLEAVQEGWLAVPQGYRITTTTSLADVRRLRGDFVRDELAHAVDNPLRNALVVKSYIEYAEGIPAAFFCANIAHAKHLAEEFNRHGVKAIAVWGTDKFRDEKLTAFENGEVDVLLTVDLLNEGVDIWQIACVGMAAPTESATKFEQRIGRGERIEPHIANLIEARKAGVPLRKETLIVLDFVDQTEKHSLVSLPSIFGLPPELDLKGESIIEAVEIVEQYASQNPDLDFGALTSLDDIAAYSERVDLFSLKLPDSIMKVSAYQWYKTPAGSYMLRLPAITEYLEVFKDLTGHYTSKGTILGNHYVRGGFTTPEEGITFADGMLAMLGQGLLSDLKRKSKVNRAMASDAQWVMIRQLAGVAEVADLPEKLSHGEAKVMIQKLMHLNVERARRDAKVRKK